ncbi:MAG: RES family NAD+ phosphorylase [bacterium]
MLSEVSHSRIGWDQHHRIIPSRFPPVGVFEDTADPEDLGAVFEVEALTNERLRDAAGEINLVAPEDRVSGPNSTVVMAAFTHIGKASRFNDEFFGAYYAGSSTRVAIAETRFHKAVFMRDTNQPPQALEMREYVGRPTDVPFVDIREASPADVLNPDPERYGAAQEFARAHRENAENGIVYPSVRLEGGECLAAFRPTAIGLPQQAAHFQYYWDGLSISKVWQLTEIN